MFNATRNRIPILAYHAIVSRGHADLPAGWSKDHAVSLESFRSHLEFMQAEGWKTILPAAMATSTRDGHSQQFIMTLDDGHASDVVAATMMKDFGYRAIFYVPWSHIGRAGFLSSSELKTIGADGFAIGSHGMTHSPLTQKSERELRDELLTSKDRLE